MRNGSHCNYCKGKIEQVGFGALDYPAYIYVCKNPECPVYALLQVPVEDMPKKAPF